MEFYKILSNYYDDIFGTNMKAIEFIESRLPKNVQKVKVLDIACGSGSEALELAKQGYDVIGTDLSEDMISLIEEKITQNPSLALTSRQVNMLDIEQLATTFDCIYCIGNSFVHLHNLDEMLKMLQLCYGRLNDNGILIIQIVNFDSVLKKTPMSLPSIGNSEKGMTFKRNYELLSPTQLLFSMNLKIMNNNEGDTSYYSSSIQLRPLLKKDFEVLIQKSAFSKYELFGSYVNEPYTEDSPALIAVLQKL
ncbi:class I SAM-dependent methyltransferase [Evansella sp. AB-rgal1]|uniref:class I SAM-dependent methyltransferase n=1 Tax=Evansella sp. AB-rgal1 TaxID=3242696 RepID=UPI00359E1138